jgi:hypothetical protein
VTAVKAGLAEIVPLAIIPVIPTNRVNIPGAPFAARELPPHRIFLGVKWLAIAQRLSVARQEAVAMPSRRGPLVNRRSRRDHRQQRENDSNGQTHKARHRHTIDNRLREDHSNSCKARRSLVQTWQSRVMYVPDQPCHSGVSCSLPVWHQVQTFSTHIGRSEKRQQPTFSRTGSH